MYTTKSGDTWDVIAKEVYGSEYHADALMAANPEHIDTFRFSAGVVLKTPTVEDARAGTLPPSTSDGGSRLGARRPRLPPRDSPSGRSPGAPHPRSPRR